MTSASPLRALTIVRSLSVSTSMVIFARAADAYGRVGGLDLDRLLVGECPHADRGSALGEARQQHPVVELDDAEGRLAVEVQGCRADFELRARVLVEPEPVAARERAVEDGVRPVPGVR